MVVVVGCAGSHVCVSVGCHPGEWADLLLRARRSSSFVNLHQSLLSVSSVPLDLRPCPTLSWPGFQSFLFGRKDAGTVIWPGDAAVSHSGGGGFFFFVVDAPLLCQSRFVFTVSPFLHGVLYLSLLTHPIVISRPYQAIRPASLIKVQSVFIHLSSRN